MDAKTLLRAKKAGARVEHPYAAYSAAGQLRCSICAVPVKQWDAHLLTKAHRQSVQREKKEAEALARKKRAAEEPASGSSKRAKVDTVADDEPSASAKGGRSALPAGFFSAGNVPTVEDSEDEDEAGPETGGVKEAKGEGKGNGEEDAELDAFLASLNDDDDAAPEAAPAPTAPTKKARRAAYKEPEDEGVASYSAAPVLANAKAEEEEEPVEEEPEETEAERRARVARDEREEVLSRLEDEERAQEDADARVDALKARMEALKKRREARGDAGKKGNGIAAKALAKAATKKKA